MTTTRINHANCSHDRTPAGRRGCRAANVDRADRGWTSPADTLAIFRADREAAAATIDTSAGKIRVGSVVEVRISGEAGLVRGTLTDVSEDIKNGRPGCESMTADRPFWVYSDQVVRVVRF